MNSNASRIPPEAKNVSGTPDSNATTPQDKSSQASNQHNKAWSAMQRADDRNVERANQQLKTDIAEGAKGVALVFEGAHNAFGYGLPASPETFSTLLDGINLDGMHIRFENHPHGRFLTDSFIDYLHNRRFDPAKTDLTFSIDPTAALATTGHLKMSIEALKASLPQSMSGFFSSGLPGIVLEADGRPYHNAGATDAQELGAMLSVALSHLKMVEGARHHIAYALPHIGFATALGHNATAGLIKLQTLHCLWEKLQQKLGVSSPFKATVHAETSMRMMSVHDIENNITRTSMAAYAAFCGKARSLSILPYSFVFGLPDKHARRIALNQQLILAEENTLDLAQHRHTIESGTLAEEAWHEFERFENAGGVMQCLLNGTLAKSIADARELRHADYVKHQRSIIGLTQYPRPTSPVQAILDAEPSTFKPEGIKHCEPLVIKRSEFYLTEILKTAPSDTKKATL